MSTRVMEETASRWEAEEMAKTLSAELRQTHHVVFFPRAIPRRYGIVDEATFAERYAGREWAVVTFTVRVR